MRNTKRIIRELLESWINEHHDTFEEIVESAITDELEEMDAYDILFNVAHDNKEYLIPDDTDIEEVALEVILNNM